MVGIARFSRVCASIAVGILMPLSSYATTIGFEEFADGQSISNQIAGLTFTNATVLEAGSSLNEFDFPPRSGVKAVVDDGGPLSILFASDMSTFSAFFTYTTQLTLRAYDGSDTLVDSASSLFASNYVSSGTVGSSPNELLAVDFAGGIRRIEVFGAMSGQTFIMDDASYAVAQVPEPGSALLAATALVLAAGARRRGSARA